MRTTLAEVIKQQGHSREELLFEGVLERPQERKKGKTKRKVRKQREQLPKLELDDPQYEEKKSFNWDRMCREERELLQAYLDIDVEEKKELDKMWLGMKF